MLGLHARDTDSQPTAKAVKGTSARPVLACSGRGHGAGIIACRQIEPLAPATHSIVSGQIPDVAHGIKQYKVHDCASAPSGAGSVQSATLPQGFAQNPHLPGATIS
jgi:hypothetical protein